MERLGLMIYRISCHVSTIEEGLTKPQEIWLNRSKGNTGTPSCPGELEC